MEKSDVLISKSISRVSREVLISKSISTVFLETLEPHLKLNLFGQSTISPFIQNFNNIYRGLDWIGNYLRSIISHGSLNTRNLTLRLDFSSEEVIISQNGAPIIVYCLQKAVITSEKLALKTENYKLRGVDCRWFFISEAANEVSHNWACKQFSRYCFLEQQDNSKDLIGYEWSRFDNGFFPVDDQRDLAIIISALDAHRRYKARQSTY